MFTKRNKEVLDRVMTHSPEAKQFAESFKRKFGFEMTDKTKFPIMRESASSKSKEDVNPLFSFQRMKEGMGSRLREADVTSSFVQLLRAGIQLAVNNMYKISDQTFEKWTTTVQSKKSEEPYAPIVGVDFPAEVAEGGIYGEVGAFGLDMKLKNRKYGSLYSASWELGEDDQTGQILRTANLIGLYMKLVIEVVVHAKLASISAGCSYSNLKVSPSEMKPSYEGTWPFHTALYGGGANRPSAFTLLTQAGVQAGYQALRQQKNQLGLKMEIDPDIVLCGPRYEFDSTILANSVWYPSVPSATAGAVGGIHSDNPLKGKFETIFSKYHFNTTGVVDNGLGTMWYLADKKITANGAFIVQVREANSVINEAPNSGKSFENDLIRFKARSRFNTDFIEPRAFWRGNDGSVTSL